MTYTFQFIFKQTCLLYIFFKISLIKRKRMQKVLPEGKCKRAHLNKYSTPGIKHLKANGYKTSEVLNPCLQTPLPRSIKLQSWIGNPLFLRQIASSWGLGNLQFMWSSNALRTKTWTSTKLAPTEQSLIRTAFVFVANSFCILIFYLLGFHRASFVWRGGVRAN